MRVRVSRYVAEKARRTRDQFRLDFFRCGGKGGQNQNKVNSGCRVTDLVTGLSAEAREERKQLQNRQAAFTRLCERIIAHYQAEEAELKARVLPSETIRSYKDGTVVDHRTKKVYDLDRVMNGDLSAVIRDSLAAL